MSRLDFEREVDRYIALEIEREVIEKRDLKADGPLLFTYIDNRLVEDVKAELNARGIAYRESE